MIHRCCRCGDRIARGLLYCDACNTAIWRGDLRRPEPPPRLAPLAEALLLALLGVAVIAIAARLVQRHDAIVDAHADCADARTTLDERGTAVWAAAYSDCERGIPPRPPGTALGRAGIAAAAGDGGAGGAP